MSSSRSHETVIDIKATPEEVFRALTDPGTDCEMVRPRCPRDPRVGGEYVKIWGPGMESKSTISAWDPYTHFASYTDRSFAFSGQGKPVDTGVMRRMAVDYYIEAIGDGVTRLRLVQSGFGPESPWDDEFESTKTGWADYLNKLKKVLES